MGVVKAAILFDLFSDIGTLLDHASNGSSAVDAILALAASSPEAAKRTHAVIPRLALAFKERAQHGNAAARERAAWFAECLVKLAESSSDSRRFLIEGTDFVEYCAAALAQPQVRGGKSGRGGEERLRRQFPGACSHADTLTQHFPLDSQILAEPGAARAVRGCSCDGGRLHVPAAHHGCHRRSSARHSCCADRQRAAADRHDQGCNFARRAATRDRLAECAGRHAGRAAAAHAAAESGRAHPLRRGGGWGG